MATGYTTGYSTPTRGVLIDEGRRGTGVRNGWATQQAIQAAHGLGNTPPPIGAVDPAAAQALGAAPQANAGGYYPFPYNMAGQAQQAAPPPPWQPQEMQRPATAYPGVPQAGAAAPRVRPSFGGNVGLARMAANPGTYTHIPWAFGQAGNYMPGHTQQDAMNAQQGAQAFFQGMNNPLVQATLQGRSGQAGYNLGGRGGMGGGSGGGAGGYQGAYDEARAENEARYRDILGGHEARRAANAGAGSQEARDIDQASRAREAAGRQSLVGRGLNNSTLLDTMGMGVERERTDAQGRLGERLRQEESQLLADELGFMERRTDSYPDERLLAQLAQGVGEAGFGAGGVGSGASPQYVTPQQMGFQIPMMGGAQMPRPAMQQGAPIQGQTAQQKAFAQQALLARIANAEKQRHYSRQGGVGGAQGTPQPKVGDSFIGSDGYKYKMTINGPVLHNYGG